MSDLPLSRQSREHLPRHHRRNLWCHKSWTFSLIEKKRSNLHENYSLFYAASLSKQKQTIYICICKLLHWPMIVDISVLDVYYLYVTDKTMLSKLYSLVLKQQSCWNKRMPIDAFTGQSIARWKEWLSVEQRVSIESNEWIEGITAKEGTERDIPALWEWGINQGKK